MSYLPSSFIAKPWPFTSSMGEGESGGGGLQLQCNAVHRAQNGGNVHPLQFHFQIEREEIECGRMLIYIRFRTEEPENKARCSKGGKVA